MKSLMVFDLDGTLAKSKSPVETDMADLLDKLMGVMKVAVISGGAWPQFEKQLLANLPQNDRLKQLSLLPTSGTKFLRYHGQWTQLYAENFIPDDKTKIINALNTALDESRPPTRETLGRGDRGSRQSDHHVRAWPRGAT